MTFSVFLILITVLCGVSSLLTESIKQCYKNADKPYKPNLIALIDAVVVGGVGTAAAYVIIGIPFSLVNIICLAIMILAIWMGSMIGYDKIVQFVQQLGKSE